VSTPKKPYNPDADLSTGLKVSIGLHVALFLTFTVRALFFSPDPLIYQSAVRVDIVGLPDKIDPSQPLPPKQESASPSPPKPSQSAKSESKEKPPQKDVEAVNLNREKNKQKEALEKLKAMSAIEKIKEDLENDKKKIAGQGSSKASGAKIKGNVLSPGTELNGLNKLQHDNYLATLDQQIKQHWFLPQWLAKKSLRTQIRLKIDEKGQVLFREIVLSSGNSSYDELALDTIDKAAPFAPPPEKFVSIVATNGLLIGFPE